MRRTIIVATVVLAAAATLAPAAGAVSYGWAADATVSVTRAYARVHGAVGYANTVGCWHSGIPQWTCAYSWIQNWHGWYRNNTTYVGWTVRGQEKFVRIAWGRWYGYST